MKGYATPVEWLVPGYFGRSCRAVVGSRRERWEPAWSAREGWVRPPTRRPKYRLFAFGSGSSTARGFSCAPQGKGGNPGSGDTSLTTGADACWVSLCPVSRRNAGTGRNWSPRSPLGCVEAVSGTDRRPRKLGRQGVLSMKATEIPRQRRPRRIRWLKAISPVWGGVWSHDTSGHKPLRTSCGYPGERKTGQIISQTRVQADRGRVVRAYDTAPAINRQHCI